MFATVAVGAADPRNLVNPSFGMFPYLYIGIIVAVISIIISIRYVKKAKENYLRYVENFIA